jgi:aryl-alcohol dehydrogenase-like predicted oxidoreductase
MLDMCMDVGCNLIDTADIYSYGESEEIVGEIIQPRRDRILVATKARSAIGTDPNSTGASRLHLIRSCDASLRRLKIEHIDLYQMHGWDGQTPLDETLHALDTLIHQGKVRYIGASNYSGWQLVKALSVADHAGYQRFVSHQLYYSLQARDAETELLPAGIHEGIGTLVWSPLAGGLLSGKYARNKPAPPGSRHATPWYEPPVNDWDRLHRTIGTLKDIASDHAATPAQVALAWLLQRPGVTSLILGARTPEQLAENLGSRDVRLSLEDALLLERVSDQPLPYPHWHQQQNAHDRFGAADLAYRQARPPVP